MAALDISMGEATRRLLVQAQLEEGFRNRLHYDAHLPEDYTNMHASVQRYFIDPNGHCYTTLFVDSLPGADVSQYNDWLAGFKWKAQEFKSESGGTISVVPFEHYGASRGFSVIASHEGCFFDFMRDHIVCHSLDPNIFPTPESNSPAPAGSPARRHFAR